MLDPFKDHRCSCPSGVDIATAGLHGETLAPSCELHQADAIRAHERAQERDLAQRRLAAERAIYDELRAPAETPPATCSCGSHSLVAALSGETVEPCAVHRPHQEQTSTGPALGSDGLTQALVSKLGASLDNPVHD